MGGEGWVLWGVLCLLVLMVLIYSVFIVVHGNCLYVNCVICTCMWNWDVVSVLCCVFCPLHMPFDPWRVQGQFIIWLWCYNTIGLQWCCSSSLTLLAPPTGPLLPTLLLLCLLGSALVGVRQCMGDPWGDGDHGSPFQSGQSSCVLYRHPFLSLSVMCVCV